LLAVDSASVAVESRDGARYTIPRALVRQVEVRQRRVSWERAFFYAALGGVTGALVGGVIGSEAGQCSGCADPEVGVLLGVPLGGLVGLIGGAVVGASTGGHRWVPARLPEPAPTVVPGGTPQAR
jgi:hypothetical protein